MLPTLSGIAAMAAIILPLASSALAQKAKDTLRYPIQEAQSTLDTYLSPGSFANLWEPSVDDNLLEFDPTKVRVIATEPVPDGLMWLSFGTPIYPRHVHEPIDARPQQKHLII